MDGARAGVKLHSSACAHAAFVRAFKCVCECVFFFCVFMSVCITVFADAQVLKSIWQEVFVFRQPCHTEVGGFSVVLSKKKCTSADIGQLGMERLKVCESSSNPWHALPPAPKLTDFHGLRALC